MSFEVGCIVKIDKCEVCPAVVGKTAKVKGFVSSDDEAAIGKVRLSFGRGRPQGGRPSVFDMDDVSLVGEPES